MKKLNKSIVSLVLAAAIVMLLSFTSIMPAHAAASIGRLNVMAFESQNFDSNDNTIKSNNAVSIEFVNIAQKVSPLLEDVENISVKENLKVRDMHIPLYVTFDSQQKALQKISNNPVIQVIKTEYGYEDISNTNWKQYYYAMYELLDSTERPSWYSEENTNFRKMRKFFDIYENEEKNVEIISLVNSVATTVDVAQNIDILELLPYDSYVTLSQQSGSLNNKQSLTSSKALGFNINNGVAYATKYAVSPNTSDYDKLSADCTNFTSQILENGGVAQVVYNDEAKGWWHKKSKVLFITSHKHSISWIRADTFAKYMGVGYSTTNHSLFTSNIAKGNFIAADYENDGDWNHMGFVTDKKSTNTNGYYDYRVAQHTSNYNAWASSSTNGWDTIGSEGGKYGRVRR